jgi:electron transfer flavoprotein-quinone oxidoreductase
MVDHVHDCIIVGAGPAGSAAALQMARDGLDVVLLERGDRPGQKNVMSGVLYTDKLHQLVPDFRERAPLQRCITGGYAMYILGEDAVLSLPRLRDYRLAEHPYPQFTVFRSQFDAWFAQEAVAAGAELFTATLVEDLLWKNGRVTGVHTRRGDLRARVVLGADGVNSTVADRSGLIPPLPPEQLDLIVRQVLNLPADVIDERFGLRPGEGALSMFIGQVTGPSGKAGVYYTEVYTNRDSLSMTADVPLDVLIGCRVPLYEVLDARERHPYLARLIEGATLREYQAHLLPRGGVANLGCLYGEGVLLAGDAGKFNTRDYVGSWPAMASGVAAAKTVKHACEKGESSRATLSVYREFLEEGGLLTVQGEARRAWLREENPLEFMAQHPERAFHVARRFLDEEGIPGDGEFHSPWGEAYHHLVKPLAPWYLRWSLGLSAWIDTYLWRRQRARCQSRRKGSTDR